MIIRCLEGRISCSPNATDDSPKLGTHILSFHLSNRCSRSLQSTPICVINLPRTACSNLILPCSSAETEVYYSIGRADTLPLLWI